MSNRQIFYKIIPLDPPVDSKNLRLKIRIVDGENQSKVSYDFVDKAALQAFLTPFIKTQCDAGDEVSEDVEEATG